MAVTTLKQYWKNEYFQTAVMIIIIIVTVLGFWYGSQVILKSEYPALAVASGSMCITQHMECDGWSHAFDHTLHIGDLIIVQGIAPEDIRAEPYPDGDIIVFHQTLSGDDLIVHRAITKTEMGGKIFFTTKGDGNSGPDSALVAGENVVGKVVARIPWLGHLALFMRTFSGVFVIVIIVAILIALEFFVPMLTKKKTESESEKSVEKTPET